MKDLNLKKNRAYPAKLLRSRGFTLVEILVSVAIFSVVMVITTGSIFSIFDYNRKSQSLRAVMDNLNLTMESMTRTIRFGYAYHCDINVGTISSPRNCTGGAPSMAVTTSPGAQTRFRLTSGRIEKSTDGVVWTAITSSDVTITRLTFRVFGSSLYPTDTLQPQVIIVVSGFSGAKSTSDSQFTLQTTISQRRFDTN